MYYGKFQRTKPGSVRPDGFLKEWLKTQNRGLSSHYTEQGFPFNTPMWNGGVGKIVPASIVYNDQAAETPSQEAWWPYEQCAYLLDGLLGVGILSGDQTKIELFRNNLRYVMEHPDAHGLLGHAYGASDSEWPTAVFFRGAARYFEFTGATAVRDAFVKHYRNLPEEKLSLGFRHINNLEGVLTAYGWSGDESLLQKAVNAYRKHDEYYSVHTEDEFELYRSKIASGRNYVIHGVSFSESIKLPVMLYLYTGDKSYLDDAERGLAEVLKRHEQIPGLPSSNEDFAGRDPLQGYETCVIQDFSPALGYFLMATGDGQYADRMEKVFYNAFPGSVLKDFCALQYLSSPNQVIAGPGSNHSFFYRGCATFRQFRADHSAQCCTGNVHRILPGYIFRMWMKDPEGNPAAVLYGPSVFQGEDYTISEETEYPFDETVRFRFGLKKSRKMPFTFRIPAWCGHAKLKVNGKTAALPEIRKGFCTLERVWKNGDTLELILPMTPVRKKDRYWVWHECGPLVYSLNVPHTLKREKPGRFAPCSLTPDGAWNYGFGENAPLKRIRRGKGKSSWEKPNLFLETEAVPVSGFDELEQGRYTPEVPLFHHSIGPKQTVELVPYGSALLRITAFPDLTSRRSVNCHQILVSECYPYDFRKRLSEQVFRPEKVKAEKFLGKCQVIEPERSGVCDLRKHFCGAENVLAYVFFRFWSDREQEAVFALSAGDGAEFFFEGKKIGEIEPVSDAEYIAPELVEVHLKRGYNVLCAKVAEGPTPMQYRQAWGVRALAFTQE